MWTASMEVIRETYIPTLYAVDYCAFSVLSQSSTNNSLKQRAPKSSEVMSIAKYVYLVVTRG